MDQEDSFLLQLAKAIQTWLWIESELYFMYAMFMKGANSHLISATFNNVQSIDAKLVLLNSCFNLVFTRGGQELKTWKSHCAKLERLNKKRNKLVHEPVSILYSGNGTVTVRQGPSFWNALAIVKGQTSHQGGPVVSAKYKPSEAKILEDHRFLEHDVYALSNQFRDTAHELEAFRKEMEPKVTKALRSAKRRRR